MVGDLGLLDFNQISPSGLLLKSSTAFSILKPRSLAFFAADPPLIGSVDHYKVIVKEKSCRELEDDL